MNFEVYNIALIPAVIGLVQLLILSGLPKKFAPAMSLVIGILVGIFYLSPGDIKTGILFGVVIALSSLGLYSGTKNSIEAVSKEKRDG